MDGEARMPVIFFGHGSPMNTLARNQYTEAWRKLGAAVPKPKAILAISAHWFTKGTAVTAMAKPRTIHDFGGFPQALFDIQYPAPGDPALAERVRGLLAPLPVAMDESWGLDHGTWSVLVHAFPEADTPVVQLSMDAGKPAAFHYELGRRLAPLRAEGVLIIGSGNVVHNLTLMQGREDAPAYAWARRFNEQVRAALASGRHQTLVDFEQRGEDARLSVPTPEHYLPLLYVAGLQQEGETIDFAVDGYEAGSLGMLSAAAGMPADWRNATGAH
ncbi:MAG: 4,5-DOPA dioxygenase extradiol [Burkholderiales bacterium]|nr:4,5-DOPA dioxygenase extradiol [Burkholderiales bacterium]